MDNIRENKADILSEETNITQEEKRESELTESDAKEEKN
jgi:hypothetical protein